MLEDTFVMLQHLNNSLVGHYILCIVFFIQLSFADNPSFLIPPFPFVHINHRNEEKFSSYICLFGLLM